jgi:tripartite tricarboxylate transporter TctB family protein
VNLRRDHLAGGVFVAAALVVFAVSGDLPLGSMAMPGAGLMPKLVTGLMLVFGVIVLLRAGGSPPLAEVSWADLPHAVRLIIVTAAGVALYEPLGFLVTMSLLLFSLAFIVERKPILPALAFSIGVTGFAYVLFGTLLKSPLPRGVLWF